MIDFKGEKNALPEMIKVNGKVFKRKKKSYDYYGVKDNIDLMEYLSKFSIERYLNFKVEKLESNVLDDIEREYLSNCIKPFREKIKYITKIDSLWTKGYCINIIMKDDDYLKFPSFPKNSGMYKNMAAEKCYTLEELEL